MCSFGIHEESAVVDVPVSMITAGFFLVPNLVVKNANPIPANAAKVRNIKNCSAAALSIFSLTSTVSL